MIEFDTYEELIQHLSQFNNAKSQPQYISVIHYEWRWILIVDNPYK